MGRPTTQETIQKRIDRQKEILPLYFSDKQMEILELNPEYINRGNICPTCLNTGEFTYKGDDYLCPDDEIYGHIQKRLFYLYLTSNIDYQYQILDWKKFPLKDVKEEIAKYINNFNRIRFFGTGMLFFGKNGTGKTWAAMHILKELVKAGYSGWCCDFRNVRNIDTWHMDENTKLMYNQMMNAEILVLDEVVKPFSNASIDVHESKLEDIIRHRTNHNFPTICTTNMTPEEFKKYYPRVYSLLSAKQELFEFQMKDARRNSAWKENLELQMNGEACPIV